MIVGKSGVKFHCFGENFITSYHQSTYSQMGKIKISTKISPEEGGNQPEKAEKCAFLGD